ncbi:hypothetical protein CK203_073906 [Vitis vinifera]|uniref:C2 domain-containing protein n=1 Tax=Vitis vinifera TaxID=29760 RepID=A0A438DPV5_VITVI|nr:hypothetical protein CK203_073906 [Vitis vinifera]
MLSNTHVVAHLPKPKPDSLVQKGELVRDFGAFRKETMLGNNESFIGSLEVYIHQARDIHNICIYHKQDVYAKFCLTSDPDAKVSTQIINGGGKNPVFNERIQINVQKIDSSLRYVLIGNGKLAHEFPLSSTELFHTPAGFVQLSLTYTGVSPEVLEVHVLRSSLAANSAGQDSEVPDLVPCEFEKIEFPDPKIVNENQMMVSKYFEIQCAEGDLQSSESGSDTGVLSTDYDDAFEVLKSETTPWSVSTDGSPSTSIPASSQSFSDTTEAAKSQNLDAVSSRKERIEDVGEAESGFSADPRKATTHPVVSVNIEAEEKVVQQEIVDMYLKSMQQFTESLAKMKLPMDIKNESHNSENSSMDENLPALKDNSPRVFYGSRAFF